MIQQNPSQPTGSASWPKSILDWVELTFKVIAISGSLLAVYQYFDVKQENRVKQTMEQLRVFNDERLQDARIKLRTTWDNYETEIKFINKQRVATDQDKTKIHTTLVLPVIKQYKLTRDIDLLVDFFENLQVCTQNRICDRQVAQDLFCSYADSFYNFHRPWIEAERKVIPGYAKRLQEFVKLECKKKSGER